MEEGIIGKLILAIKLNPHTPHLDLVEFCNNVHSCGFDFGCCCLDIVVGEVRYMSYGI